MKHAIITAAFSMILSSVVTSNAKTANCDSLFAASAKTTAAKSISHADKLSDDLRAQLQSAARDEKIYSVTFLVKRSAVTRITRDLGMMAVGTIPRGDHLGFVHTIRAGDVALLSPRFVNKAVILKLLARKTVLKVATESRGYLDRLSLLPDTTVVQSATVLFQNESDPEIAKQIIQSMGGVVRDYFGTTFFVDMPAGSLLKIVKLPDVDGISF